MRKKYENNSKIKEYLIYFKENGEGGVNEYSKTRLSSTGGYGILKPKYSFSILATGYKRPSNIIWKLCGESIQNSGTWCENHAFKGSVGSLGLFWSCGRINQPWTSLLPPLVKEGVGILLKHKIFKNKFKEIKIKNIFKIILTPQKIKNWKKTHLFYYN